MILDIPDAKFGVSALLASCYGKKYTTLINWGISHDYKTNLLLKPLIDSLITDSTCLVVYADLLVSGVVIHPFFILNRGGNGSYWYSVVEPYMSDGELKFKVVIQNSDLVHENFPSMSQEEFLQMTYELLGIEA